MITGSILCRIGLLVGSIYFTATQPALSQTRVEILQLGSKPVEIEIHQNGEAGPCFLILHGSEQTATRAVRTLLKDSSGVLFRIKNLLDRNLRFVSGHQTKEIDPNRMFTPRGRELALPTACAGDTLCRQTIAVFAEDLLRLLPDTGLIVSVHSNTDGAYSIHSYQGPLRQVVDSVCIQHRYDADDFFFVTTADAYRYFKTLGYNVALQKKTAVFDDGSLSVYLTQTGRPMVTVECQAGHLTEQVRMLKEIYVYLRQQQAADLNQIKQP